VMVRDANGRKVSIPTENVLDAAAQSRTLVNPVQCLHFLRGNCHFGDLCRNDHSSGTGKFHFSDSSRRRGRSKKRSRSRDRRMERSRSPGWGERSSPNRNRASGWESRSSGQSKKGKGEWQDTSRMGKGVNFIESYMNISQGVGREAGREAGWEYQPGKGPDSLFLAGDWLCPACGDHQFAKNQECRMCSTPRMEEGKAKGKKGKKGMKKGDKGKEKGGGKGKTVVTNGLEDYEEDSDQLVSRSASRDRNEEIQWNNFTWDLDEWGEREDKLMELPNSWMGLRTYEEIMKRAKKFVGLYGGKRKEEASLLVCPGCHQQVGGGTLSRSDAESSFWSHVTSRSANEAMHGTPSHKRSHLKLEMFEQVRATYYEEVFREEKEEREGGEALPARSSATREVRMAGSATDRNVVRGSRKLKKNAPKR
jgi:hypothetical protein